MSEAAMVQLAQDALGAFGISDRVLAVGQFNPTRPNGGLFAGGLIGGDAGRSLGAGLGGDIGVGGESGADINALDVDPSLPSSVLVAVCAEHVYGLDAPTRQSEPRAVLFQLRRDRLQARVHEHVNVRVIELTDQRDGRRIELEGNRLPVTHANDVIDVLTR